MPREIIGSCGSAGTLEKGEWPLVQLEMAIVYLKHVCGKPPIGCELEVVSEDVIREQYDSRLQVLSAAKDFRRYRVQDNSRNLVFDSD